MKEKFEDTCSFIYKLQMRKMQEEKEVDVKHTTPKDKDGKGKTAPVKKVVKRKVDKPKNAKVKAPKDPNILEASEQVNESILTLAAIEKILKKDSTGKEGAIGAIEFLKSNMGGSISPELEKYIDMLYNIVTGKNKD